MSQARTDDSVDTEHSPGSPEKQRISNVERKLVIVTCMTDVYLTISLDYHMHVPLVGIKHVSDGPFSESFAFFGTGVACSRPGILRREVLNWHWQ
jgi:hypothetical protein